MVKYDVPWENLTVTEDDILIEKNSLERAYNDARHELVTLITRYYRQDIASSYVSEDDIRAKIDECEKLKKQYIEARDKILHVA